MASVTEMKIAFDLDGVLLPDYNQIPKLSEDKFFEQTLYAKPLFQPTYEYDIVTARLEERRDITEQWLEQMQRKPANLFMNTDNIPAAEFKYKLIRANNYGMYVESDIEICKKIRELYVNDNVHEFEMPHIIHFGTFVHSRLYEVLGDFLI